MALTTSVTWAEWNSLLTSIGPHIMKGVAEQHFHDDNVFLGFLREKGHIKERNAGGDRLSFQVSYGKNSSIAFRSTKATIPETNPADEFVTQAAASWAKLTGQIWFWLDDLEANTPRESKLEILETQFKQAINTALQILDIQMVDATSANVSTDSENSPDFKLVGLPNVIGDTAVLGPNNLYGLPQADILTGTTKDWKAQVFSSSGNTAPDLRNDLEKLFAYTTYGMKKSDVLVTNQTGELRIREMLGNQQRDIELNIGDFSYTGLAVQGRPVIVDPNLNANDSTPTNWTGTADSASTWRIYALYLDSWYLYQRGSWTLENMIESQPIRYANAFKVTYPLRMVMQLVCKERFRQGLLRNNPNTFS